MEDPVKQAMDAELFRRDKEARYQQALADEERRLQALARELPDLRAIFEGKGESIAWPEHPLQRHALLMALSDQGRSLEEGLNAFRWMAGHAGPEWVHLFGMQLLSRARAQNQMGYIAFRVHQSPELKKFLEELQRLLGFF